MQKIGQGNIPLTFILVLWCIAIYRPVCAQTPRADSIQRAIAQLPDDTAKVNALYELSRVYLIEIYDIDKFKTCALQQLTLSEKLHYKKGRAYAILCLGTYYRHTGKFELSIRYLNNALKMLRDIHDKKGEGTCYLHLGNLYHSMGNETEALRHFSICIRLRKEVGDQKGMASAHVNMANIFGLQGKYPLAIKYYLTGLKIYEATNEKSGMASVYNNMGDFFNAQNKKEQARIYFTKCIQIGGNPKAVNYSYTGLGAIYFEMGNLKKALAYSLTALKLHETSNNKKGIMLTAPNLASVYLKLNKPDSAEFYLQKSYNTIKDFKNKEGMIVVYHGFANLFEVKKNYAQALNYYQQMLDVAKEIHFKQGIRDAYQGFASVYRKTKEYERALQATELYTSMKDSLLNAENFRQVAELNTKYETDKKENEILLLTKDQELKSKIIKQQQLERWGLIGGAGLLFLSSVSIYRRYRYKQRANHILEKQKQVIEEKNMLITDSIDYAKNIQEAILPSFSEINRLFPQCFLFYKPKDIVSGDFYWVHETAEHVICAVADGSGHGVPGAFMSLMGHNMFENSIQSAVFQTPAELLQQLHTDILQRLSKGKYKETIKKGIHISLIFVHKITGVLQFAGANNMVYILRNEEFYELNGESMGIGLPGLQPQQFHNHSFPLRKGDMIYLFTDGFLKQLQDAGQGGDHLFREQLHGIHHMDVNEQARKLNLSLPSGEGKTVEQTDDILILGIRY